MNTARIILLFPLALIRLVLILLISVYTGITGLFRLKLFGFSRRLQNRVMSSWGKSILFVCGIKVCKNELPVDGCFIIMPNHRSYIDIFLLAAFTPAAFVAKAELEKWPLITLGAKLTNSIFVERSDIKSLVSTMNKIKSSVDKNIPLAIFPEGTTYKGPLTKPFKKGSFKIAADTGIPVIPVAIHYRDENDAWIDNDSFIGHFFRQMSKPVTYVQINYGTPVTNSDFKILQKKTREHIDMMLKKMLNKTKA